MKIRYYILGVLSGVLFTIPILVNSAPNISANLAGRILLQVEENGEAWYVNPTDLKRYYLKDGDAAYEFLRKFGLGISNKDIEGIVAGDNPSLSSATVQKREQLCYQSGFSREQATSGYSVSDVERLGQECANNLNLSYDIMGKLAVAYQNLQKTANTYKSICTGSAGAIVPSYTIPKISTQCSFNSQYFGQGYTSGAITCF